jgi:hypothetical protein
MNFLRFEIVTCPECKRKYVTIEGIDNAYNCECGYELINSLSAKRLWYSVPESQLITFIEKFYRGEKKE